MARRSHATAQLRREVESRFPLRDTGSDGWIGDPSHQARPSDHNPDADGVVHAEDFDENDHDGSERVGRTLWDFLLEVKDPRTKYVIYERRMFSSYAVRGYPAWTPRPYTGENGHLSHLHISVYGDDGSPWGFAVATQEDDDMALRRGSGGPAVKAFQRALVREAEVASRPNPLPDFGPDGDFGAETERAVRAYQAAAKVIESGAIDGVTAALLARYITVA